MPRVVYTCLMLHQNTLRDVETRETVEMFHVEKKGINSCGNLCCSSDIHILKSNKNELTQNTATQRRIDVILLYYITSHNLSRLIESV